MRVVERIRQRVIKGDVCSTEIEITEFGNIAM
jgi:hypothetical protein